MKLILKTWFIAFLCASAAYPASAQNRAVALKIQQIENNLASIVRIRGDPNATLEQRMKQYKVAGLSIAVINNGQLAWAKGYGFANADSTRRIDENTLFQAASISKPIAALTALHWVERGKLSLDADINTYLTDWKIPQSRFTEREKITLRRLLTHTTGLTVHGFRGYAKGKPLPSTRQIVTGQPPANNPAVVADTLPGSTWRYSGGGYLVMQNVLEDVLGKPFGQIAAETVLSKLSMTNSTFEQPLPERLESRAATGFFVSGKPIEGQWRTYPEKAAAGLWTTPTDLARYVVEVQQSLRGKGAGVLSKTMTRQMLTPNKGWGLGPAIQHGGDSLLFSHSGANVGFRCHLVAYAYRGQGAVVMTNSDNGDRLIREVLASIAEAYNWADFKPTLVVRGALSPEQVSAVKGNYQAGKSRINVIEEQGRLLARTSFDGTHEFFPVSGQEFILANGITLQLRFDTAGKVTQMTDNAGMIFTRKVE